jgi:hypothetical protein
MPKKYYPRRDTARPPVSGSIEPPNPVDKAEVLDGGGGKATTKTSRVTMPQQPLPKPVAAARTQQPLAATFTGTRLPVAHTDYGAAVSCSYSLVLTR